MLRCKYKLYNGTQPHQAIVDQVPSCNQQTDLFLGQFYDSATGYLYGDMDIASGEQSGLETALANWQVSFFADDNAAKSYVDGLIPADTLVQKRITWNAATINGTTSRLEKLQTEHDPP